ncbi:hypothetical protein G6F50_014546 [Rhizopus delemar]|uniref:Uncharacterized protein n=1 Tax=Rhizopus delemar TaxID=936053 RepID=A0A9P6Y4V2_9FUNG|nr:hypothetical protein G6F50_014546 [Rhizopus delemar]
MRADGAHQQRVAVRRRLGHHLVGQGRCDDAADDIGGATRRIRDDDAQRLGRVTGRRQRLRAGRQGPQGGAGCTDQQPPSHDAARRAGSGEWFHGLSPLCLSCVGTSQDPTAIAPLRRSSSSLCGSSPSMSRKTVSVWAPSTGGALRYATGVAERCSGLPTRSVQPACASGIGTRMPRCRTCGSANTSAIPLIGPQGTANASSVRSQCALECCAICAWICGIRVSREARRAVLVA